jgi:hypothetical protein
MHTIINLLRSNRIAERQRKADHNELRAGTFATHGGSEVGFWTRLPGSVRF